MRLEFVIICAKQDKLRKVDEKFFKFDLRKMASGKLAFGLL